MGLLIQPSSSISPKESFLKSPNSHGSFMLSPGSNKEHAGGAGTAGIWVGTPRLGIAMIQKNQVQFPFMD